MSRKSILCGRRKNKERKTLALALCSDPVLFTLQLKLQWHCQILNDHQKLDFLKCSHLGGRCTFKWDSLELLLDLRSLHLFCTSSTLLQSLQHDSLVQYTLEVDLIKGHLYLRWMISLCMLNPSICYLYLKFCIPGAGGP